MTTHEMSFPDGWQAVRNYTFSGSAFAVLELRDHNGDLRWSRPSNCGGCLRPWAWFAWWRRSDYARNRWVLRFLIIAEVVFLWRLATAGPNPLRVFNIVVTSIATTLWLAIHIHNRRQARGRNRSTQAHHRDPQAVGAADPSGATGNSGAGSSASMTPEEALDVLLRSGWSPADAAAMVRSHLRVDTKKPGIDVVQEDMPILAHRAARLVPARGGPSLAALNQRTTDKRPLLFGVDEDAKCQCKQAAGGGLYRYEIPLRHEQVPHLEGECGWYAVPADVDSWHDDTTVDLLVELSGRVIEHEKGYRAEHQRVIEVRVPACQWCGEPSEVAMFDETACKGFCCHPHGTARMVNGIILVTIEALSERLGVPVVAE